MSEGLKQGQILWGQWIQQLAHDPKQARPSEQGSKGLASTGDGEAKGSPPVAENSGPWEATALSSGRLNGSVGGTYR
jgi:hypothetical protein